MTPNRQIDPESIQRKLKYAQVGKRLAIALMWCGVAVIVIPTVVFAGLLDMPGEAVPGVLVGMLLFIVGLIIKKITDRHIKKTVAADSTRAGTPSDIGRVLDTLDP